MRLNGRVAVWLCAGLAGEGRVGNVLRVWWYMVRQPTAHDKPARVWNCVIGMVLARAVAKRACAAVCERQGSRSWACIGARI
jgi:hypothetical protein